MKSYEKTVFRRKEVGDVHSEAVGGTLIIQETSLCSPHSAFVGLASVFPQRLEFSNLSHILASSHHGTAEELGTRALDKTNLNSSLSCVTSGILPNLCKSRFPQP